MPQYEYQGINASGRNVKGTLITESANSAKSQLRRDGIFPSIIREMEAAVSPTENAAFSFRNLFQRISSQDLSLMTRQLATLVGAHIPLIEALSALTDQIDNSRLKATIAQVKSDVNEGATFQKALARFPNVFSNLFVNMVGAGEASGTLDLVLSRLADFLEYQERLTRRVRGALLYPLLMVGFGGIAVLFIFIWVIPQLAQIFEENKTSLPLLTQIMLTLSQFLVSYWWLVIMGVVAIVVGFRKAIRTHGGAIWWDDFQLKIPVVGELIRMVEVSRFTKTLGTMLQSGIPLLTSLNVVRNVVGNQTIQRAIDQATQDLTEGANISDPLMRSGQFPPLVTHMISVGEKTGELEMMLDKVSEHYENQVNTQVESFTKLLEPVMIIVMAGVALLVVLSVVLPMLELNDAVI